jgi:photosystem II stability/assembly factor-like uncharacterized protein
VTKVSAAGTMIAYSTYLGGSLGETEFLLDFGVSVAVDAAGRAYVTGRTNETDFPILNAFQGSFGGGSEDAFVTAFAPDGSTLVYSTYLGGSVGDQGLGIIVGPAGDAYVTGMTVSSNFPTTPGAFQTTAHGQQDAFVTRLNAAGNVLTFSTYLGGNGLDFGNGIALDGCGNVYVTGDTRSTDFPTKDPLQASGGGTFDDAFVTQLTPEGSALVYSTYFGGSSVDVARGIGVDAAGNAYVAGLTESTNFPTKGPAQSAFGGLEDAFITRILPGNATTLPTDHWTAEGPAPILNGQTPGQQPVTGRITAVAAHPTDPDTLYVAAAGGGVWKTTDGGLNWMPLTDDQPTLFMGALALAPSDPNVIYAGTGEANFSADSYYGRGILKSTNAGATWTLLTGTGVDGSPDNFDRRTISKIVVDPTSADTVYVAVAGLGTNSLSGNTGIWKSTDGGLSWVNTTTALSTVEAFTDLVLDPTHSQVLFAAVGSIHGSAANGVYQTPDGGATWSPAGNFPMGATDGRIALALAPSAPQTLYASIAGSGQSGSTTLGTLFQMLKSSDGGTTWNLISGVPNYLGKQGWYDTTLAVDPLDDNVVYAGGAAFPSALIRSFDGGRSWSAFDVGSDGHGPHSDHHAFAFDAAGRLLDGNDGGLWRLNNQTPTRWADLNGDVLAGNQALAITQFTGIALDPLDPKLFYGGSQDNGTEKTTEALAWTHTADGDGGFVRVDGANPNTVYHTFFRDSTDASSFLERSDDGGNTWTAKVSGIGLTDPSNFYPPYIMDPANPARLLLGTDRVYETTNHGDNWFTISAPNSSGWNTNQAIDSLAVAPGDAKTIYATAAGQIYVTSDGGRNWKENSIFNANDHVSDLLVDPLGKQKVYAVRDQFDDAANLNVGHVFRTTDGGSNWTDISGNLPDVPVYTIALDPRFTVDSPQTLYVGTDKGVFFSTNGGTTWQVMASGLPNVQVRELAIDLDHNLLAAGTHGRGLWEIGLSGPGGPVPPPEPPGGSVRARPGHTEAPAIAGSALLPIGADQRLPAAVPAAGSAEPEIHSQATLLVRQSAATLTGVDGTLPFGRTFDRSAAALAKESLDLLFQARTLLDWPFADVTRP